MHHQPTAALAAARLQNYPLPLNSPRTAWPTLIERAADLLLALSRTEGAELLARELRSIAAALRGGQ